MVQPEPLGEGKGAVQWGLTPLFGLGLREDNSGFILGRKTERDGKKREREGEEVGRELQRQDLRVRIGTEIITKVRIYVQLESGVKSWIRVCRRELGFG